MWQDLQHTLRRIVTDHPDVIMASSLAAEDMILLHALVEAGIEVPVFTLNTGRLPAQTLDMVDRIAARYGRRVQLVTPEPTAVTAHVAQYGEFAFYESLELRQACCRIRKVEPLRRVLSGRSAWITGQRREQAISRLGLEPREHDTVFGLIKFNPLAEWQETDVWRAIRERDIPYNPLHDQGYPSIGCEPCTRAVRPGEDPRAGRWWWEQADSKECGLHADHQALRGAASQRPVRPRPDLQNSTDI